MKKPTPLSLHLICTATLVMLALGHFADPASAATDTWNGGAGGDGNWLNGANWGGSAPNAGDQLLFDGSNQLLATNNFGSSTIFQELDFSGSAGAFTLWGNSLTLTNGLDAGGGNTAGGSISNLAPFAETINLPITLSAGRHNIASLGGSTLGLNAAITRTVGALAVFDNTSGIINASGGLTTNGFNNILGGWATLGGNWATLNAASTVIPFSGYTTIATGAIANSPASNVKYTNDTGNLTAATGTTINSLVAGNTVSGRTLTITGTMKLGANGGILRNGPATGTTNFTVTGGLLTASGGGEITLSDAPFASTTDNLIIASAITNDAGNVVSVNTIGYVQLNGINAYSGGTYVSQGRASATNGFGSGAVYVFPGGEAWLSANLTYTNSFFISGIGPAETSAGQNLGAIRMNTGATIISGPINLLGNARISGGSGAVNTITGQITGPGRLEFTAATGNNTSINLNNPNNDWSGGLRITAGGAARDVIVKLAANNQIPDGAGKGDVTLNGGTAMARLDLNGFNDTINGLIGSLSPSNQVDNFGTAPGILTLGNNNATTTFGGILGGNNKPNTLSLVKIGSGTQTLSGANTYFGNTTISNGVLALSNSATIGNTSLILVNSGATFDVSQLAARFTLGINQTLGGNGVVTGNVATVSRATISPGFSGAGTLSFSNDLTLNGCTNFLDLSTTTSGANDQIMVAGNLTLTNLVTIWINPYGGTLQNGRYKLILYGGALTTANTNLVLAGIITNSARQTFTFDTSIANEVDLVVGGSVGTLVWKGDGSANNWDSSSLNWLNGLSPDHFYNNDAVTFNDTGSENPAFPVQLVGALAPSSILVSNAGNYSWTGLGNLTGATTTLTKQGSGTLALLETGGDNFSGGVTVAAGTLILSNANMSLTGGLTVNAGTANLLGGGALAGGITVNSGIVLLDGTASLSGGATIANGASLQVGNNDANGTLPSGNVTMNGSLAFNQTADVVVNTSISGGATGTLTKNGPNVLTLGASNAFTGAVTVQTGTLRVTNNASLGSTSGGTIVLSGASLDVAGAPADNVLSLGLEPITVSGAGVGSNGAIINNGTNSQTSALRVVTLAGDTWFGGSNRWDIRAAGATTGDPAGTLLSTTSHAYNLTKVGSNFVGLVSVTVDPALGNIDVQGGTLDLEGNTTGLGDPTKTITVWSNADLFFFRSTNLWNKHFVLKDGATLENNSQTNIIIGPLNLSTNAAGAPGNCIFNIGGNWMAISNVISGPGKLVKNGGSILYLAGTNTYTGSTLINTGTLALVGNGSISASTNITLAVAGTLDVIGLSGQNLTLASGQRLQGNGTNNGSLTVAAGATVMAGTNAASIGKLTVKGTFHFQGTNYVKIDKANALTNDLIVASPIVSYEGGTLNLVNIGATAFAAGDSFSLFRVPGNIFNAGAFTISPATPGSGLVWNTNNLALDGTIQVVAVPRPVFSSITTSGTNVILRGANSTPTNATYYMLTSTNIALPLTNWARLATNQFLNDGTFSFTNGMIPSIPQRYYLLQVP